MKAILNVNKKNQFASLNGHTFDVISFKTLVALNIFGTETDFTHYEILVVDFAQELQKAYDSYRLGRDKRTYFELREYEMKNGMRKTTVKSESYS